MLARVTNTDECELDKYFGDDSIQGCHSEFVELEIKTLEDLMRLQKRVKCSLIVLTPCKGSKYDLLVEIYDNYRE